MDGGGAGGAPAAGDAGKPGAPEDAECLMGSGGGRGGGGGAPQRGSRESRACSLPHRLEHALLAPARLAVGVGGRVTSSPARGAPARSLAWGLRASPWAA